MNRQDIRKGAAVFGIVVALMFILQPLTQVAIQDDTGTPVQIQESPAGVREDPVVETSTSGVEDSSTTPAVAELEDFNEKTRSARKYLDAYKLNYDPVDPEEGDAVTITADIQNKGTEDQTAYDVNVEFWYDGDNFIGSQMVDEIEPDETVSVELDWQAIAGEHEITVAVDPDASSGGPDELTVTIEVDEALHSPYLSNSYSYRSVKDGETTEFYVKLTNKGTATDSYDIDDDVEYDGTSNGWDIDVDRSEVNDVGAGTSEYIQVTVGYDEANPVYYKEATITLTATSQKNDKKYATLELRVTVINDKPILFVDDDGQHNDVPRGRYKVVPDQHGPQSGDYYRALLDYFYPGMWDEVTLQGDSQPSGSMSNQGDSGPPMDDSYGVSPYQDDDGNPIYLENYDLIIWDTCYSETLTANTQSGESSEGLNGPYQDDGSTESHSWYDQQELMSYLDNGGALWWAPNKGPEWHDQDAGTTSNLFLRDYFQVDKFIQSTGNGPDIVGVGSDPIGRGVNVKNGNFFGVAGDRADLIIPREDAKGVLYSGSYFGAIRYEYNTINDPTFRTFYQSSTLASVGDWHDYYEPSRMKLFEQAVFWLGVPVYNPPEIDLGVHEVNSPLGEIVAPGEEIPLTYTVKNYGQKDVRNFNVDFKVLDRDDGDNQVFSDTLTVSLDVGETLLVESNWDEAEQGKRYGIVYTVRTDMGDEVEENDEVVLEVTAKEYYDVGVEVVDYTRSTHYWNSTRPGDDTTLSTLIHNYGSYPASFRAEVRVKSPHLTDVFIDSTRVEDLAPGDDIALTWEWISHKAAGVMGNWHADSARNWDDSYNLSVTVFYNDDENSSNDVNWVHGDSDEVGLVSLAYYDSSSSSQMKWGQWTGVDLSGHDPGHPTPIHQADYHMQSPTSSWTACVEDDPDDGGVEWGYVYPNWKTTMVSPQLDFSDFTSMTGCWVYGGMGSRGTFYWEMSTNFNGIYDTDNVEAATWNNVASGSGGGNPWGWYLVSGGYNLDSYAGEESVHLRLRFQSSVSSRQRMGVFVDSIGISGVVKEYNFPDLAMKKLSVNPTLDKAGEYRDVEMVIHNSGQVATTNRDDVYLDLSITKDDEVLDGYPQTFHITETLDINEELSTTHRWRPEEDGDYVLTAQVHWEEDGDNIDSDGRNDAQTVMAYAKYSALYDDCESGSHFDGGVEDTILGNAWDIGVPTSGPGFAYSGENVWATGLGDNYPDYDSGRAFIQREADLSTVSKPVLSFWHWLEVEGQGFDTASVKIRDQDSRAGDWVTVWENPDPNNAGEPYYTDGWEFIKIPLVDEEAGYSFGYSVIDLRFELESDGDTNYEGWYIDDIAIGGPQPPEKDASMDEVLSPENGGFVFPGTAVTLKMKVSNVGTTDTYVPAEVVIYEVLQGDETYWDTIENLESPTLGKGSSAIITTDWVVPFTDGAQYRLYFRTKLSGDDNPLNNEQILDIMAKQVHDIGVVDLYAKPVIQNLNNPRTITAELKNFGNVDEDNIKVSLTISDINGVYTYTDVEYISLLPQDTQKVEFKWTSVHYEEYRITVNVTLDGGKDEDWITGLHRNEHWIGDVRTVERIFYDNCETGPVFQGEKVDDFWTDEGDGFQNSEGNAGWHEVDVRAHQSEMAYYCGRNTANGWEYENRMDSGLESKKVDLSGVTDAKIRFYTWFYLEGDKYDNLHVSIRSENNDWFELNAYPRTAFQQSTDPGYTTAVNGWLRKEFTIPDEFLEDDFQMMFRLKTDSDLPFTGPYIDDISLFASPTGNHPPFARFSASWVENTAYSYDLIRYPTPEVDEVAEGDMAFIRLPQASMGLQGGVALVGDKTELVSLNASYSFDPDVGDQTGLDYVWDFGDGSLPVTGDATIDHQFEYNPEYLEYDATAGKSYFNVTLTVRDQDSDPEDHADDMVDFLWVFVGNTPPEAIFQIYSDDRLITADTDDGKDDEYVEVFWGDSLEFSEVATDAEGELNPNSFVYDFSTELGSRGFSIDKTIYGSKMKFQVGGKLLSKDGATGTLPGTFFSTNGEPTSQSQPHEYLVRFTVKDLGGEQGTVETKFLIYPYARNTWETDIFTSNNEVVTPQVELRWRGFEEEAAAVEAEIHPDSKPVFVKIEEVDTPTTVPPQGALGVTYKVTVMGTKLQNGRTGYHSAILRMPFSSEMIDDIGTIDLRDDVRLYEYSRDEGKTFIPMGEVGEDTVQNGRYYAIGLSEFEGYGSSTSEEISMTVAPIVSTVYDGTALPDLRVHSIEFSRAKFILGTEIEIRAYIDNVGDTHARNFKVRFLDGDSTIGEVEVELLEATEREFLVVMPYNASATGSSTAGEPMVEHELSVVVDADRDIFEGTPTSQGETNNKASDIVEVVEFILFVTPSFASGLFMAVTATVMVTVMAAALVRRRKHNR